MRAKVLNERPLRVIAIVFDAGEDPADWFERVG